MLLDGGAKPNITEEVSLLVLRMVICVMNYVLLSLVCLQSSGWSPLFFSTKEGDVEITRLLLEGGADVKLQDKVDL